MKRLIQSVLGIKKNKAKNFQKKRATVSSLDIFAKTVLLRTDFNVPINNGKIKNNFKIKQSIPTIKELLKQKCKVVIISHLGRPNGKFNQKYSLAPVAKELAKLLPKRTIHFSKHCIGSDVKEMIKKAKKGQIILLENLRFYKEEAERDLTFAHSLADLASAYVFDAFAVSHRRHTSTTLLPAFLPSAEGLLVQDEVGTLNSAMQVKKGSVWVIGGSKLDKINIIKSALKHAEKVFVGGALVFSFLRAKGIHVGHSKISRESVKAAKEILKQEDAKNLILSTDAVVSNSLQKNAKHATVPVTEIPSGSIGLDIGLKSTEQLIKTVSNAKQVIWNGPLGFIENTSYRNQSSCKKQC